MLYKVVAYQVCDGTPTEVSETLCSGLSHEQAVLFCDKYDDGYDGWDADLLQVELADD
jgi:hypothetical protein